MTTDITERFLFVHYYNMAVYYRPHSCRAICNTGHRWHPALRETLWQVVFCTCCHISYSNYLLINFINSDHVISYFIQNTIRLSYTHQPAIAVSYGSSIPGKDKRFLSFPKRPDRLWSLRSLLSKVYREPSPGAEWAKSDTGHSHASRTKIKNEWSRNSSAPYTFIASTGTTWHTKRIYTTWTKCSAFMLNMVEHSYHGALKGCVLHGGISPPSPPPPPLPAWKTYLQM